MKNIIPGADKLIRIMEALAESPRSIQELTDICEISATTCYRAVQTLLMHGWIYRDTSGLFEISAAFRQLSEHCNSIYLNNLKPRLEALSHESGLAAKLSIREGDSQLTLLRADSPKPFGISLKAGTRFPVVEGTVGAALLCDSPLDEVQALCEHTDASLEEHSFSIVATRIETIRQQGWLFSEKLTRWNILAMSTPLHRGGRVVAALTLIGGSDAFTDLKIQSDLLMQVARKMEETL
ncbi:MAG: helix-turn-helix domain-containing protein [Victivallales bacterium]|nr:helix-turn-helix domain-containing protein [Victivallales bacterium]